ncbi:MAG: UPF0102 protein [Candidatus Peregrinibacteria bacterium Gr01-1014_25]|nr:MAG: UPF0102 protein [Candidatus Peregrinibacteria bacterium Gr01-1014_25]
MFSLLTRRFHPQLAAHLQLGRRGERIAAAYLRRLGYRILARNVRLYGGDEIDVIAIDPVGNTIVFVEVKTRAADDRDFNPELNLTPAKKRRMCRAARKWLARRAGETGCRLDALCVAGDRVIAHIEDLEWTE